LAEAEVTGRGNLRGWMSPRLLSIFRLIGFENSTSWVELAPFSASLRGIFAIINYGLLNIMYIIKKKNNNEDETHIKNVKKKNYMHTYSEIPSNIFKFLNKYVHMMVKDPIMEQLKKGL
jgi:hypothetical protein